MEGKVSGYDMLNWANNDKGDSDGKTIVSDVNNARKDSETEIKMIDLTLKVDSNSSEARSKKKIICLKDTNGSEQIKRMEGFSDKLNLSSNSTNEDEISLPSNDIEFVGLNAENWKKMIKWKHYINTFVKTAVILTIKQKITRE